MPYDVAVVGAGPSGAWTATLLARRGARVLLIDPSHPREKPCGGGITGRALAVVGDGIPSGRLRSVRVRTARFLDSRSQRAAAVTLDDDAAALVVASRAEFDGLLYDAAVAAGADAVAARVIGLTPTRAGFQIAAGDGRRFDASLLVGADGANSLVRRRMSTAFRRDQLSVATGFFARGVTSDEIVIELTTNPPGYMWSFPRPDHLAIGVCAQADSGISVETLRLSVREWMATTRIAQGAQLDGYAWPIPSLSAHDFASLTVSGPGWLTVGDAAGLVDPTTREGIFFALQSAMFAADALASSSRQPARVFADRVRDEIGGELARAARYKAGFFRPRFTGLMLDALASSHRVRAVVADLVAGTQGYRDLKWRLARTWEPGLATRMLVNWVTG